MESEKKSPAFWVLPLIFVLAVMLMDPKILSNGFMRIIEGLF